MKIEELKAGLPEDPVVELETKLAGVMTEQARDVLLPLLQSLAPGNATRVLAVVSSLVATYNNGIAELQELGSGAKPRRRRGNSLVMEPLTEYVGGGTETFGAQAIQQMVAMAKDLIPSLAQQKHSSSMEIARLTSALAEARAATGLEGVAGRIEARLNKLLDDNPKAILDEFLDGEAEEIHNADYPLPPVMVGGFPVGGEGADDLDADGDGPDARGGGAAVEVPGEGAQEEVAR
jgi:hypothetical protein